MDEMPRPPGPKTFTVSGKANYEKVKASMNALSRPMLWEQVKTPDGDTVCHMTDDGYATPMLVPVELRGVELAAALDPHHLVQPISVLYQPEIVTADEHALRGLWIEKGSACRFLVTELKSDFFYACGYREFRDERGVFEVWSCNVGNLSLSYYRADGRVPDRDTYEGRYFVPR